MAKRSILLVGVLAMAAFHAPIVESQAPYKPGSQSGMQGAIQGLISSASDTNSNVFETMNLSLNSIIVLLNNCHYTLSHNPFTQAPVGFHDLALGATLASMRGLYAEHSLQVMDIINIRLERIDSLKAEFKRVRNALDRSLGDIRMKASRCLTAVQVNEMINDVYTCSSEAIRKVIEEVVLGHSEVEKLYTQMNIRFDRRDECLKMPLKADIVPCVQSLSNEMPAFMEMLYLLFSPQTTIQEIVLPINECLKILRNRVKDLCRF